MHPKLAGRAAIAATAAVAIAMAGCASRRRVETARHADAPRERWTIAVSSAHRALPEVQALVRARGARFDVRVIEFDPAAGTADARLGALRAQLAKLDGGGQVPEHLLVVGSPAAIPMGPWEFEGAAAPIVTDWLLTGDCPAEGAAVRRDDWQHRLRSMPRRTVGRIPFDDPRLVAAAAAAALAREEIGRQSAGHALLGAAGTGYAWPLASARRGLRDAGWTATLDGRGGSCDGPAEAFDAGWRTSDPALRPALVIASGSQYGPLDGEGQPRGIRWILRTSPWSGRPEAGPGAASVFVAFVPGFARPGNPDLADLFASKRVAAVAGFTGDLAASPLGPALESISGFPRALAAGEALGTAVERERMHYWGASAGDLFAWMPSVQHDRAVAALSAVVYGDPATQAARVPAASGAAAARSADDASMATPVLVVDGKEGAPEDGDAEGPAQPGSRAFALTTALFAIAVALLAAFAARRSKS